MKDIIKLNSRYKENNYLKLLKKPDGSESKTYVLKVSTPHLRVGYIKDGDTNKNKFIDPSGGPMIRVGCKLEEANAVVKSVDFIQGYGWTVTFS